MKKINILESLLELDKKSSNRYELATLYEACKLKDDEKVQLVKYIDSYEHPSLIGQFLESKCEGMCDTNVDDDDCTDIECLKNTVDDINDNEVPVIFAFDDIEEIEDKESLNEEIVIDDSRAAQKYVWNKVKEFDSITDDDSMYWQFDDAVRQGDSAKIITDETDLPDSAFYKFSFVELDMNIYFDYDNDCWYVLDKTYEAPVVEESVEIHQCPVCGRNFAEHEVSQGACPKCGEELHKTDSGEYEVDDKDLDEKWEPEFSDEWRPEDIELWKSIDWKARNYEPYIDETKKIRGKVKAVGLPGGTRTGEAIFAKEFSANPIFAPRWEPITDPFEGQGTNGWYMYDGVNADDGYMMMTRTETQEVSDMLSESLYELDAGWTDYCPHCTNRTLVGVGDDKAVCDECGAEFEVVPMANGKVRLMEINDLTEGFIDDVKKVGKTVKDIAKERWNDSYTKAIATGVKKNLAKTKLGQDLKRVGDSIKDTDTYKKVAGKVNDTKQAIKDNKHDNNRKPQDISLNVRGKDYRVSDLKFKLNGKQITADDVAKMSAFERRKVQVIVPRGVKPINEGYFSDDDFEDDIAHANLYGGDTTYCRDCGTKKVYDEDGFAYCPKCNDEVEL